MPHVSDISADPAFTSIFRLPGKHTAFCATVSGDDAATFRAAIWVAGWLSGPLSTNDCDAIQRLHVSSDGTLTILTLSAERNARTEATAELLMAPFEFHAVDVAFDEAYVDALYDELEGL